MPHVFPRLSFLLMTALLPFGHSRAADFTELYQSLDFGPHPVGFQSVELMDRSRTYYSAKEGDMVPGRPLQMAVWYPAESGGQPLTFAHYISLLGQEIPSRKMDLAQSTEKFLWDLSWAVKDVEKERIKAFLDQKVAASLDAKVLAGKHPLIIHGSGSRAYKNSVLSEYLASHGMVVVCIQGPGSYTTYRGWGDPYRMEDDLRDLEFRMAWMSEHWRVDPERIGLISFSLHAGTGILAAMRHPRIKALVTLDGHELYTGGKGMFEQTKRFQPADFKIPMLQFSGDMLGEYGPEILERLIFSQRRAVRVADFSHIDFLSAGHLAYTDSEKAKRQAVKYGAMARQLQTFLKTALARPEKPAKALQDKSAGTINAFSVQDFPAKVGPPTSHQLAHRLIRPEGVAAVLNSLKAEMNVTRSEPPYSVNYLVWLGRNMIRTEHRDAGFEILKWSVALYPDSIFAAGKLAYAYRRAGLKAEAIQAYQHILKIDPENQLAKARLAKLKEGS